MLEPVCFKERNDEASEKTQHSIYLMKTFILDSFAMRETVFIPYVRTLRSKRPYKT